MEDNIQRTAVFDETGTHRYRLGRRWTGDEVTGQARRTHHRASKEVSFIMLNPSAADHTKDDPTLRACIQFAQRWSYGALSVVNLFSYRTAHPRNLKAVPCAVKAENDDYVIQAVQAAAQVVLAWGNWGTLNGRDQAMLQKLQPYKHKLHCLRRNQSGQPCHPLYIPRNTALQPFYPKATH